MAFDALSKWFGWEHVGPRAKAFLSVTVKGGDSTVTSSDQPGAGWAQVVALTDGVADAAVLGSAANPMNVAGTFSAAFAPPTAAFTDLHGTITTGGTAQNFIGATAGLKYLRLANPSNATESLFYNDMGSAATGALGIDEELIPGAEVVWSVLPTNAVSIWAATTAHAFKGAKG